MAYKPHRKGSNGELIEIPLFAEKTEKDSDGNVIKTTYLKIVSANALFDKKADKNNANQDLVSKTMTAKEGVFENISNTLTEINNKLNTFIENTNTTLTNRGQIELLYSGQPTVGASFTLSKSVKNFKYLFFVFLTSGGYVVSSIVPVSFWADSSLNDHDWIINGSINSQVRYYQLRLVDETTIKVGERSNAENIKIFGMK